MGQPNLVEHGIQTEDADYRFHVVPKRRWVIGFDPVAMFGFAQRYRKLPGFQAGVTHPTALGYIVPIRDIGPSKRALRAYSVLVPDKFHIPSQQEFSAMSTSDRGRWAVELVKEMLADGDLPIYARVETRKADVIQDIAGTDLIIVSGLRVQVKFDNGGTGENLYIQIAERNPLRRY